MKFSKYLAERAMILVLVLVQGLVMVVGYLNFRKLNEIAGYVQIPEKPAPAVLLMRDIISDLQETERNVKSFYLTRDGSYLSGYYGSVIKLSAEIDRLDTAQWRIPEQKKNAEDLIALFEQQLLTFNKLIYLDNNEHVTNELQTISEKVERIKPDTVNSVIRQVPVEQPKKKRNFFARVFGNKDDDTATTFVTDTIYTNLSHIGVVKKDLRYQVTKVKSLQTEELKRIKAEEFQLTAENIRVASRIRTFVTRIEESEQQELRRRNERAAASAASAKQISGLFSILIISLLLFTSITITRYFIRNRRQSASLEKEKKFAQQQAESKQNLVANMSHEMRTPLNSIIGFSEQVLQTELQPEQQRQVTVVKKSADHLLQVINNMLDSSRLEAGKLQLQQVVFSPGDRLREIAAAMTVQTREKNLELHAHISQQLPGHVTGDPVRFAQVVINILGNAIKYTEKGSVTLAAEPVNGGIQLRIADTGVGIPAEKLDTIFNRFEQASTSLSVSGAGLGLSIARQLIELQGGTIALESKPGIGTVVTITWPCTETAAVNPETKKEAAPQTMNLAGKHVLVADDEVFNRMLLAAILKKYGITFTEAEDGKQALELVQQQQFDLVLMDMRMPVMTGLEATAAIRKLADARKAAVPVIALTAGPEPEKRKRSSEAGVTDFLAKPFREAELLEKMTQLLT